MTEKSEHELANEAHSALLHKYNVTCDANRDYMPTGMLYFEGDAEVSFMEIKPYDPIMIVPILEAALIEKFGEK